MISQDAAASDEAFKERAAILAVENDFPDEESEALAWFWHAWEPPLPTPSRLTYAAWPLRPAWAQTVRQLRPYISPDCSRSRHGEGIAQAVIHRAAHVGLTLRLEPSGSERPYLVARPAARMTPWLRLACTLYKAEIVALLQRTLHPEPSTTEPA